MKKIEIGKAVSFGWEAIKKDFWYFIGLSVLYLVLTSISSYPRQNDYGFLGILQFFISAWLTAGFLRISLDYYEGEKRPFETLFTQIQYFWRILGAQLLVGLIVIGGFILLIIPGIYWALKYQFVPNFIVDKNLGILEAMGKSGEITKGIKLRLLLFDLVMLGIFILGVIVLGVGIIVAFPIIYLANIYVYKKLQ